MNQKDHINVNLLPAGIALLWISLGFIALGIFSGGAALLLGALGLLLLPICKWLATAQISGLEFSRRLPRRVFSGEQFTVEATICNRNKYLHACDLNISDSMADAVSQACPLPFLEKRGTEKIVWLGRLFRRGWNGQDQISVSSTWPLGLFEARFSTRFRPENSDKDGILVVPRPLTPEFLVKPLEQLSRETALLSSIPPDAPTEFRFLREFRSGDAIKTIHWPSSTRTGQLFIRETDPPIPSPFLYGLLLHSFSAPGEVIRNDRFETMLRIATGLITFFQKQEMPLLFSASFEGDGILRVPSQSGYSAVLDQIARAALHFSGDIETTLSKLNRMAHCDQVFVLGTGLRSTWESEVQDIIPSCICIDPESMSKGVTSRKIKMNRKAILQ